MNFTLLTIIGCSIIFFATTLGATIVFFIKKEFSKKLNSIISGFSAGIMIAASVWGLIIPSMDYAHYMDELYFLPTLIGIILGCFFLLVIDLIIQKLKQVKENSIISNQSLSRFLISFTIHNIPEGMAVGFAFGSALSSNSETALLSALGLAIAIAVQNIPEGVAVAMPVFHATKSKKKGFVYGMLSGIVEPFSAIVGIILASQVGVLLPWVLAFSAGCMIFVTIDDLIPESKQQSSSAGAWAFMTGFIIMMILDIILA